MTSLRIDEPLAPGASAWSDPDRWRSVSVACGLLGTLIGAVILIGWTLGVPALKGVLFGGLAAKSNAAVGVILIGLSVCLVARSDVHVVRRWLAQLLAAVALTVGALTALEYATGVDLGIDQLLFTERPGWTATSHPNRMGPPAAVCLVLLGTALLLVTTGRARLVALSQHLAFGASLVAVIPILSFVYAVRPFYLLGYTDTAFPMAVALLVLGAGVLAARPASGIMRVASGHDPGGVLLRHTLPVTVVVAAVLGFLTLRAERAGVIDQAFGTGLLVVGFVVLSSVFLLASAVAVRKETEAVREAVDAYRKVSGQLTLAVRAGRLGTFDWDPVNDLNAWSEGLLGMYGLQRAQFRSRHQDWLDAVVYEDRDRCAGAALRALERTGEFDEEFRIRRRDTGEIRWIHGRAQVFYDDARRPTRMVGIQVDITERKRAEDDLRRSEEILNQAGEMAHLGAWWIDVDDAERLDANPLHWSDEVYRIFGYEPGAVAVSNEMFFEHVHPDDRQRVVEAIAHAAAARRPYRLEHRIVRPDGSERIVHEHAEFLHDERGRLSRVVGAVQDVTDRTRMEEALRAAQQSAERAKAAAEDASRAKDHFLAILSHELRTPLTPVLTAVSLLQRNQDLPDAATGYLTVIRRNVELESRLIDDLLDVARIERGKVELDRRRVPLCTVIERAVEVCRPDIEARRLHFGVDLGPRPYIVDADSARLQQVFWNLLKNAVKFTPPGGCVGVRCRPEDGQVMVEVTDSGIGIEPAVRERIFTAFTQADRSITRQFGGLGLGLAITKALVEMHGGSIEVASEGAQRGATFTVRLPLIASGEAAAAEAGRPRFPARRVAVRPGRRLLLVEDHGDAVTTLVDILELHGHQVQTAGDVDTALEIAAQASFDVLISDLGLPDRSGLDLLRALRERGHTMPAIALSGYGQESDLVDSRAAGFTAHLVKPVDPERLLEEIDRVAGAASL